jgi:polysaccharide export outer membrane protein
MKRASLAALVGVGVLLLTAAAKAQDAAGDYRVGPRDLLEIKVLELPELNVERRVTDSGSIELPLVGPMPVAGLTASEVKDRLESIVTTKYVNRANVSVVVKEFANKPVSVLGAVLKPGTLSISGRWTLMNAITAAGGLTERAGRKIYVLRRADNGLSDTLEIDTADLFQSATPYWNIPIQPADVINVRARTTITVYCLGEVKTPGALQFDSEDRVSLLSVISKAGGLTDRASKTIRVKRKGKDGKDSESVYEFGRIMSGKDPDPVVEPDDVVVVKESFF